jgi:hypothetical protein
MADKEMKIILSSMTEWYENELGPSENQRTKTVRDKEMKEILSSMTEWYENELLGVCYQKVSEQTQLVRGEGGGRWGGEKGGDAMPAAEDMQPSLKIKISDRISAPAPSPTL